MTGKQMFWKERLPWATGPSETRLDRGKSGPLIFQGQDTNKLYIHEGISEACGNELTASTTATKGIKLDWVGLGSLCSSCSFPYVQQKGKGHKRESAAPAIL